MALIFNGKAWVHGKPGSGIEGRPAQLPPADLKVPHSASYKLLLDAIIASTGDAVDLVSESNTQAVKSVQVLVEGTGSVSATVIIEASNNAAAPVWFPLKEIAISGTNSASDGFLFSEPWAYVRARITVITGTGAKINAVMVA